MQAEEQETIKCTNCKKKFYADGFGANRLGVRYKTCLECGERRKAKREKNKCEHNRQRSACKDCGGSSICEHNRRRSECKDCGGASICEHNRLRSTCKDCGGVSICEHNRRRSTCKDCGGVSNCEHNRLRSTCKDCGNEQHKLIKNILNNSKKVDKKNNRYDQTNFIDYCFVENLLDDANMMCGYCACEIQYIEYNSTLASIERKDNSIGHIKGNCMIACLKCNIKRVGEMADTLKAEN